ncbi:MAG TPA: SH3 domain-containing protein [Candidatus Ozemobacteraceae bacterium]|nr:SH3 domain-containing protein [Candidatus Ozemobacteraceae bacterium]
MAMRMMGVFRGLIVAGVAVVLACSAGHAQTSPFGGEQVEVTTARDDADGSLVSINGSRVNVRSGPGTQNAVLQTLPRGTSGRVLAEKNGWKQVDFGNGLVGWVRADLLAAGTSASTISTSAGDRASVEKSIDRWSRHLSKTVLDYSKIPWYWKLGRAWSAFKKGNYEKAYELAQDDSSNPVLAKYLMARALYQMGKYSEAKALLAKIERTLEDAAFRQVIDAAAKPYIDEPVVFKFGGFDDVATYRKKKASDNRLGLNSAEYYDRFVDINTWKWKSKDAYNEFQKIGGIDCSGFVQRVQMDAYRQAGIKWPLDGRTSTSGLWSQKNTREINPGFRPPPPPGIRPGDMILFDYGHNRYGHSTIYRGIDANGNIRVVMMGDTAVECVLPPEKFQYYKGTYRMNGMDEVRKKLTA